MSDKLNKSINESMLEGLLSDSDKPKPTLAPVRRTYYDDDDYYANDYGRHSYSQPRQTSIFDKRTAYPATAPLPVGLSGGKEISSATMNAIRLALADGKHSGQKHYFMDEKSANELATGVVRAIGEVFDAVGLCWGASGSKAAKALVFDMLSANVFYNTPSRGYKELDFGGEALADGHDPETGEVEDIERKAIMEIDGEQNETI